MQTNEKKEKKEEKEENSFSNSKGSFFYWATKVTDSLGLTHSAQLKRIENALEEASKTDVGARIVSGSDQGESAKTYSR